MVEKTDGGVAANSAAVVARCRSGGERRRGCDQRRGPLDCGCHSGGNGGAATVDASMTEGWMAGSE
ncbi:hypothetical protein SESBI_49903 [Sesbania bispinosa]|nr:hypothetical protein SESBI_49903 [Sesbania bispinosa]